MQGPGVAANKKPRASRQRDQFRDAATHRLSRPCAGSLRRAHQFLFARTIIENRTHTLIRQLTRNFTVPLRGPSLRPPARARIQNRKIADVAFRKPLLDPRLSPGVARKIVRRVYRRWFHPVLDQRLGHRKVLLDDVPATHHRLPRVPQARWRLSRVRSPIHSTCPRPPRQQCRSQRALQIYRNVVVRVTYVIPNRNGALQGQNRKQRFSPCLQVHGVHLIDQRPQPRPASAPRRSRRAQQFGPPLFNQPADKRLRECFPQGMDRGQRVDHVSHGAEPHDQQALGAGLWRDIDPGRLETPGLESHGRPSRDRIISLVE